LRLGARDGGGVRELVGVEAVQLPGDEREFGLVDGQRLPARPAISLPATMAVNSSSPVTPSAASATASAVVTTAEPAWDM